MSTLLKVQELATRLRVKRKTAERMCRRGEFPNALKVNGDWRVPESDVDAYLASRRVVPPAPVEGGAA